MREEELSQMSNNELIGIIKAQRFEIKQLENIRKEIKEYIEKNVACFKNGDMLVELNVYDLVNILKETIVKNKREVS